MPYTFKSTRQGSLSVNIGLIVVVFSIALVYRPLDQLSHPSSNFSSNSSSNPSSNSLSKQPTSQRLYQHFGKTTQTQAAPLTINAKQYRQFWIWTPPKNSEKLQHATTLYILQGEIRQRVLRQSSYGQKMQAVLTAQGIGVRPLKNKKIWLTYRINNQITNRNLSPVVIADIRAKLAAWQQAGNEVEGIQIDFDAPTFRLDEYNRLLTAIRQQLPPYYKLSVTGLLDWANQSENPQFLQLGKTVDELVMQTYQGTTTLPNYQNYLRKLQQLPFDFKVGIVEHGQWQGADFLEENPHFKGYVVFLR